MVLRELLAVFGLQFDDRGMRAAEGGLKKLTSQAEQLAQIFSAGLLAGAATAPFVGLAKLASDAQEELNRLGVTFQENADDVVAWADSTAKAMGRSKYELRSFAGNLGLVFRGMGATTDAAAKMATGLAGLAVDFSSLSNFSEAEVLNAFRSGITGETESLKRLGIVMTETELKTFALSRGMSDNLKAMTSAQKAALRYEFLVAKAGIATGDAANTSLQFANAVRRVRGLLLDVGTEMGLTFLPAAEAVVNTAADLLVGFRELAEGSHIFEGALLALGLVAGVALLPLLTFVPLIAAFAFLALVLDDIISYLQGEPSLIGDLVQMLEDLKLGKLRDMHPALQAILGVIDGIAEAIARLAVLISTAFQGLISGDFTDFQNAWFVIWEDTKEVLATAVDFYIDQFKRLWQQWSEFAVMLGDTVIGWFDTAFVFWRQQFREFIGWLERGFMSMVDRVKGFFKGLVPDFIKTGFRKAGEFVGVAPRASGIAGQSSVDEGRAPRASGIAGQSFVDVPQRGSLAGIGGGELSSNAPAPVSYQGGETRLEVSITQQPGESGENLVGRLRGQMQSMLEERDQAVLEGLVQKAGT